MNNLSHTQHLTIAQSIRMVTVSFSSHYKMALI
ncbi:hypothetical protein lpymt_00854 [Legionella pneumophila]|nr:hypothetical protein lpymt_00854 [Legionella pneumophila]